MKQSIKKLFSFLIILSFLLSIIAIPASAVSTIPDFTTDEYVDLLPYMEYEKYGIQEDSDDGVRINLTKEDNGYNARFNSQAVDYGVRFNYDIVNPDGTVYYKCALESNQDLWDSDIARVYGGQVLEIGYGKIIHNGNYYNGYYRILFSEQDGIDVRFSDAYGTDVFYLGANTNGLKVNYPDTHSKYRGYNDYEVLIKLNKQTLTVWVNEVIVIDVNFSYIYDRSGNKINCELSRFSPGISCNATRTSFYNYRMYCSVDDAAGAAIEGVPKKWYVEDGILNITGDMGDFSTDYTAQPWYEQKGEITTVFVYDGVERIGDNTFSKMTALENVFISNSVIEIGEGAFSDCPLLEYVNIPYQVIEIPERAFYNCRSLNNMDLSGIVSIGDYAFYRCDMLENISLDNAKYIGNYAFYNCFWLDTVVFSDNLLHIGEMAFGECINLSNAELPESVIYVDETAFDGCMMLEELVGDLDYDGELTAKDLIECKKILLFDGEADINGDEDTNVLDYIFLSKILTLVEDFDDLIGV